MLLNALNNALDTSPELHNFFETLQAGNDAELAITSQARPLICALAYLRRPGTYCITIAGQDSARLFARNLSYFVDPEKVLLFEERDDLPGFAAQSSPEVHARRAQVLDALKHDKPCIIVTSAQALCCALPAPDLGFYSPILLKSGADLSNGDITYKDKALESLDMLCECLSLLGYNRVERVKEKGQFSLQGGSLDIYPGQLDYAVRIDFFGDEIEDIRRLVLATAQSIQSLEELAIYPVIPLVADEGLLQRARRKLEKPADTNPAYRELLEHIQMGVRTNNEHHILPFIQKDPRQLCDYMSNNTISVLIEPRSLLDNAQNRFEALTSHARASKLPLNGLFIEPSALRLVRNQSVSLLSIMRAGSGELASCTVKRVLSEPSLDALWERLRSLVRDGYSILFSLPNTQMQSDFKLSMVEEHIPFTQIEANQDCSPEKTTATGRVVSKAEILKARTAQDASRLNTSAARLRQGIVSITSEPLPAGMVIPSAKLALVSASDLKSSLTTARFSPQDITQVTFPYKPGDYIVHVVHGISYFKGLVNRSIEGVARDYLHLEFAGGEELFVPVEQLDRVTRYVGPGSDNPQLSKLGGKDWARNLAKARKAARKLAFDLVDLYSQRSVVKGFAFSEDTPWQREMEASFPYEETPDQLRAIHEVKADMESSRPMDRLLCGDVGFGKTEVALRAAFKAVQDKKQVMVLCPTTILAQQHYSNFKERFEEFGVRVEVLSRFCTSAQIKNSLAAFRQGSIDVLIGTHRMLSRDVNPRNLGLVIIDEEQRFGVSHKEQLKQLRQSIDVLTLSATPIPRTLQMSLSGVRDMSLILSPPQARKPVEVHVGEWDLDLVSAAIRRELERKGQVYYVSNRVRSIQDAYERVRFAAEEARIGIAHGQMSKQELEEVMEEFSAGKLDVLVATTIIESGIDNPHTNTLIIEDAHHLGLSQMYQLKGRVGRSNKQAYAYFLVPSNEKLTEEATARLLALGEHKDLGSGMRIAMRDLEIRGAGSLLGAEQSGNLSAIGFDLFAQMIAEASKEAQSAATPQEAQEAGDVLVETFSDTHINIGLDAYIADSYIADIEERMLLYRRIAACTSLEYLEELRAQTLKEYPSMPREALNFFSKARIRIKAHTLGIRIISLIAGKLVIEGFVSESSQKLQLSRLHLRYNESTKRLSIPAAYVSEESLEEAEGAISTRKLSIDAAKVEALVDMLAGLQNPSDDTAFASTKSAKAPGGKSAVGAAAFKGRSSQAEAIAASDRSVTPVKTTKEILAERRARREQERSRRSLGTSSGTQASSKRIRPERQIGTRRIRVNRLDL